MKEATLQRRKERFMTYNIQPRCATAAEFDAWCKAEKHYRTPIEGVYFCTDCTPEFAGYNRRRGDCNHHDIIFGPDGEGYALRPRIKYDQESDEGGDKHGS